MGEESIGIGLPVMALVAALTNCGGASARPPTVAGSHVNSASLVIRVDYVRVSERPGGPWDSPPPQPEGGDDGCELFGVLAGAALGPEAVAAKAIPFLCKANWQPKQEERIATLPDLQVRLSAGAGAGYATDIERDVDRCSFHQQPFVVPIDAIPADGLRLEVYDDDGAEGSELAGAVRLYRDELIGAVGRPAVAKSDSLATFEFVVSRYNDQGPESVSMQASEGTRDSRMTVAAGEVVRVTAAGHYKVGSYFDTTIGPEGYPGGGPKGYNFTDEPLKSAPHGSAFVLVGEMKRFAHLTTPGGNFLSPVGGALTVGIDDADPANDSGTVAYSIERRAPTAEEWQRQETTE